MDILDDMGVSKLWDTFNFLGKLTLLYRQFGVNMMPIFMKIRFNLVLVLNWFSKIIPSCSLPLTIS